MECMKYSKMDKKSSEMFGAPLKCLTIEEHGLISEDRRLKAENPKTLWILTQDDMTHDHETDTKSLDATETSSMLLEDVEIKNFQLKELETRAETLLNENEKFIATIKSIFSVCKEYHDKLSCLTTGQQVILKEEETLSEPLKSTGGDTESLKMDLKTLTSMLKEKDQLITELRSQIERLTQKSQEMEELEASLCEKKQTTIENFKSDLGKESLDTKIPLNKNEEIQNQMTEELTRSKVEAAELEEGMKQLEKLKKSHEESVDELKIKEEEVKLVAFKSLFLIFY